MEVHGETIGPYFVDEDVDLHGMVRGTVYVRPRGVLNLYGVVTGDLRVQAGGIVTIHGTVNGFVENVGASVEVYGRVGGIRNCDPGFRTVVGYGAVMGTGGQLTSLC